MTVLWHRQKSATLESFSEREIEERGIELWAGEVVEDVSPAGKWHSIVGARIFGLFYEFCVRRPGLFCVGDGAGFIVSRDPDTFLSPDVALFRLRFDPETVWYGFAPDVAVEIVSPRNRAAEILAKRDLYLAGGSEQVWIVDPERQRFEIHFSDGRAMTASEGIIEGAGIAEGLRVDLGALFAPLSPGR